MKKILLIGCMILFSSLLISCTNNSYNFIQSRETTDFTQEKWHHQIDTDPNKWIQNADHWFLTGDPNATEMANRHAPYSAAISTMIVRVPDFTRIKTHGCFQVQIFGTDAHNSVYVYGPNAGVSRTSVRISGDTLFVDQIGPEPQGMNAVIVRIGVNHLTNLTQRGAGPIVGRQLRSNELSINSYGSGNVLLAGTMNLKHVNSLGSGHVTILGAYTPSSDIKSSGSGDVNVSGDLGIQFIKHRGSGNINLIGANTNSLDIFTEGRGKIGIVGPHINLKKIMAGGSTCTYIYWVDSDTIVANSNGSSRIGLAGYTNILYINASGSSRFEGRYLRAKDIFVKTKDSAHANVSATNKVFASAVDDSSIYFFGPTHIVSRFTRGNGTVITMSALPPWYPGLRRTQQ